MRTIIAGSRTLGYKEVCIAMLECGWTPTLVVSGMARGVDQAGEKWAIERGIPIDQYPADWDQHGKLAGYIRNEEMGRYADSLVAVWDGKSRGTRPMIELAKTRGLQFYVWVP